MACTNLRNYFDITGKQANAETAVKVAGATAKHCIVIHGQSNFLSGNGQSLDFDQDSMPDPQKLPSGNVRGLLVLSMGRNLQM